MMFKQASVCIIENDNGEILLLERVDFLGNKVKGWCLPGGKMDEGETSIQTAVRETFEETGLYLPNMEYIGESESIIKDKYPMKVHVFYAEVENDLNVTLEPNEHTNYVWTSSPEEFELAGNTIHFINLKK